MLLSDREFIVGMNCGLGCCDQKIGKYMVCRAACEPRHAHNGGILSSPIGKFRSQKLTVIHLLVTYRVLAFDSFVQVLYDSFGES